MNRKYPIAAVPLAIGAVVGSLVLTTQNRPASHQVSIRAGAVHTAAAPVFPLNSRGQTYGSAAGISNKADLPDLVLVRADNGVLGYITKADFIGPTLRPQMVKTWPTDAHGNYIEPSTVLPVYAQNGVTQVGLFTTQAGQEGNPQPAAPAATTTVPLVAATTTTNPTATT